MASPPIGIHDKCDTVFHSRCLFQATILCCVISSSFAQCLDDLHEPILVYDFAESLASQFLFLVTEFPYKTEFLTNDSIIRPFLLLAKHYSSSFHELHIIPGLLQKLFLFHWFTELLELMRQPRTLCSHLHCHLSPDFLTVEKGHQQCFVGLVHNYFTLKLYDCNRNTHLSIRADGFDRAEYITSNGLRFVTSSNSIPYRYKWNFSHAH